MMHRRSSLDPYIKIQLTIETIFRGIISLLTIGWTIPFLVLDGSNAAKA